MATDFLDYSYTRATGRRPSPIGGAWRWCSPPPDVGEDEATGEPDQLPWGVFIRLRVASGLHDWIFPTEEAAMAAADDAARQLIASHVPKPEDQPIRRGDVVQVTGGEFVGLTGVVVDPIGSLIVVEFRAFDNKFRSRITGAKVEPENLVRIGRARYRPDGTPVED